MTNTDGNRSHAVVARRHEAANSLDDFPTPCWATRALVEHVLVPSPARQITVWEPACNRGHMARPLGEYFGRVYATDIVDYGYPLMDGVADFLTAPAIPGVLGIITNPPFNQLDKFILRALAAQPYFIAMLARTSALESEKRWKSIYQKNPPSVVAQFVERVPMFKGRLDKNGSTATSYCWLTWRQGWEGPTQLVWIPPCRKKLERPEDYA